MRYYSLNVNLSIFYKNSNIVVIYIDDLLIASLKIFNIDSLKKALNK
jgi:hypothetical protein